MKKFNFKPFFAKLMAHKGTYYSLLTLSFACTFILMGALSYTLVAAYKETKNYEIPVGYVFTGAEKDGPKPLSVPVAAPTPLQAAAPEASQPTTIPLAPMPEHALMLTLYGFGANDTLVLRAMKSLPASISLAFSPYLSTLKDLIPMAKAENRAYFIDLPLDFHDPTIDAGPLALDPLKPFDAEAQKKTAGLIQSLEGAQGVLLKKGPMNTEFLSTLTAFCQSRALPLYTMVHNEPLGPEQASLTLDDTHLTTKEQLDELTSNLYQKAASSKVFMVMMHITPLILEHLLSWVPSIDPAHFSFVSPAIWGKLKEEGAHP